MQRKLFRNSFLLALAFSVLFYTIFTLIFIYIRSALFPEANAPDPNPPHAMLIKHLVFSFIMTLLFTFALFVLNFKLFLLDIKPVRRVILLIVCTLAAALALSYMISMIQMYIGGLDYFKPLIRGNTMRDLLIAVFIMFTSSLLHISNKQQQTALENRTLIAENMRTRYEALKNQVDPHFLFNSLNTLHALIKIDADKAQQYVQQLSFVFRYTLQNREIISLEEELRFTQAYCHLMQIRYGENLRFEYRIDPRFNNYRMLPLSLLVLVENAIKHNVVSARQPLTVRFATGENGSICVSNPVQLKKEAETGEGIGLVNLSERYRLMWQQDIVITHQEGFFRVEVPLLNS